MSLIHTLDKIIRFMANLSRGQNGCCKEYGTASKLGSTAKAERSFSNGTTQFLGVHG